MSDLTTLAPLDPDHPLAQSLAACLDVGAGPPPTPPARSDYDLNPGSAPAAGLALRPAAVLAALGSGLDGTPHFVFTTRAATLVRHAGQIAFPGGRVDADDPSHASAALREAHEEIGLTPGAVAVLGRSDAYATVTGFAISPFVGVITAPFAANPAPAEVADVFTAPAEAMLDPARFCVETRHYRGVDRSYFTISAGARTVWGATAGVLKALSDRLHSAPDAG